MVTPIKQLERPPLKEESFEVLTILDVYEKQRNKDEEDLYSIWGKPFSNEPSPFPLEPDY